MKSRLPPAPTRTALLHELKQHGPAAAEALAEKLGVTPMAIRQHLYALQESGVVSFDTDARTIGRPAKLWRLTRAANPFFSDRHAELTLSLLEAAESTLGSGGLERLLQARAQQQMIRYEKEIPPKATLAARVKVLARLRAAEGYMAEARTAEDGSQLLVENHCPICTAAERCRGLCGSELEVFQRVLGPAVNVERTEHVMAGDRRCVYRITAKAAPMPDERRRAPHENKDPGHAARREHCGVRALIVGMLLAISYLAAGLRPSRAETPAADAPPGILVEIDGHRPTHEDGLLASLSKKCSKRQPPAPH